MVQNVIDAEIAACDALSLQATQIGAQAFARLLKLAETRDSGQIPRVARFLAATYNGQAFQLDPFRTARRRHRHQQRHAVLPGCAALGPRRPAHAHPRW
jgi:hypothetical protein